MNNHLNNNKKISKTEWESVTSGRGSHKMKLTKAIARYENILKKRPSELDKEILRRAEPIIDNLKKLDKIKQDCFYFNWKDKNWFSYQSFSKIQQKAIAFVNLSNVKFMYYVELKRRINQIIADQFAFEGKTKTNELTEEDWKLFDQNPYQKLLNEITSERKTSLFKGSTQTFRHILFRHYSKPRQ